MNTHLATDIKVLDNILALNLRISLWSARSKLKAEDFGGVELPPEDLASLGYKKICDPAKLNIFNTLKARAFNLLDRYGIRFLGGWAIPEDKADPVIYELCIIRDDFHKAKDDFLLGYDQAVTDWIDKHPNWSEVISDSVVSSDYVRSRLDFSWQLYRVAPATGLKAMNTMSESGLAEEIEDLAGNLFIDIAKQAREMWTKVYEGKDTVTHKALSPLRSLHTKLLGLSFVEPHVMPVVDLIDVALVNIPKRGNITGGHLLMLQGLVSLLKDPDCLIHHARKVLQGKQPEEILSQIIHEPAEVFVSDVNQNPSEMGCPAIEDIDEIQEQTLHQPVDILSKTQLPQLPESFGLW